MGLTEVIGEVRRDGEARAQQILDDARTEADAIIAKAQAKADAYQAQRAAQAERDGKQVEAQVLSHAEFEARKLALTAESEMREELRALILEGFGSLKGTTRSAHIKKLLATAKDIIGDGSVFGAAADEEALKKQRTFAYGGTTDIVGGIIVESEDGTARLDLSYETLLDDMWRDILGQEAGLFN